jgi:hypothetical protein
VRHTEHVQHAPSGLFDTHPAGVDYEFRRDRGLIGIGDPREPQNVTSAGFRVKAFGVPPLTFLEGCRNVDLHEVPAQAPDEVA